MKKWIAGIALLSLFGCLGEDDTPQYNPIEQLEVDRAVIEQHLTANNITTVEDEQTGIRYIILEEGNGMDPIDGDVVLVNYELYNLEGDLLDTNVESVAQDGGIFNEDRNYQPLQFQLGTNGLIPGFQRSTLLLTEEGKGDFYIPSVWCYQNYGSANIEPNENLRFIIELVKVNP